MNIEIKKNTEIKIFNYKGWTNSIKISNNKAELIITTDVGPRIIKYSLLGKDNEFCEIDSEVGSLDKNEFTMYGGHRLWHAPQIEPRNSQPDNEKLDYSINKNSVTVIQKLEKKTGLQKEMEIFLLENSTKVKIVHKIYNKNLWDIEFAVWSLSMMEKGGFEIIPINKEDTACLPNRTITYWPWTKQNDTRIFYGSNSIFVRQDANRGIEFEDTLKIGTNNKEGWVAYVNKGHVFIKTFKYKENEIYPDNGSTYETFTNNFMLELETLSPLKKIKPNSYIEHIEEWEIFDNVDDFILEKGIEEDYIQYNIQLNKKTISAIKLKLGGVHEFKRTLKKNIKP
ncbi:MAG: hypothetical protein ACRC7W_07190 [Fusobacteriaceae bacterium]